MAVVVVTAVVVYKPAVVIGATAMMLITALRLTMPNGRCVRTRLHARAIVLFEIGQDLRLALRAVRRLIELRRAQSVKHE
eukprot:3848052-Pleurochrysis_carterae.AAC.1